MSDIMTKKLTDPEWYPKHDGEAIELFERYQRAFWLREEKKDEARCRTRS